MPATLVASIAGSGRGALCALLALAAGSCAGLGDDVHLSPFASGLSTAGGGHEFEALAGSVRVQRATPGGPVERWAVRPLVSERIAPAPEGAGVVRRGYYLVPFGTWIAGETEDVAQLLPLYRYHRLRDVHGHPEWHLFVFPILLWSHDPHGRTLRAVFPIAGVTEHFLSFDRVTFFLFPLLVKTERGEFTGWHVFWPIFRVVTDVEGVRGWRVWPLYGSVRLPNYQRYFFLWPIFHYQKNNLTSPEEEHETRWMVFPLLGHARAGDFRAWTLLWPFFGFSRNPDTGFWAWDGPWPLVRIQRPGTSDHATRTRFWPLWSRYSDKSLDSTWVLWPFYNQRLERFDDGERRSEYFVPLWQNWERTDLQGDRRELWSKLWPFFQRYEQGPRGRSAWPALSPLWHTPVIDEHYSWIYELYAHESDGRNSRKRSWGGIWRREADAYEERTYVAGLWSKRKYREQGANVRETSLLFGLLRWRTRSGSGTSLMRPAFPGPGWPAERCREPLD